MAQDVKEEQATESLSSWQSGLRFRGRKRFKERTKSLFGATCIPFKRANGKTFVVALCQILFVAEQLRQNVETVSVADHTCQKVVATCGAGESLTVLSAMESKSYTVQIVFVQNPSNGS